MSGNGLQMHGPHDHELEHAAQHDPKGMRASLDRLLHVSHGITIRSDSYHLRTKRRAGLFNQASANTATQTDC